MAEIRRGYETGTGGGGAGGGERLPWLEPVEDEDYHEPQGGGVRGPVLVVIALLLAAAIAAAAFGWLRGRAAEQADIGTTIRAEPGPYKVRAPAGTGMEIASAGAVAERTGVGGDINSPLDLTAIPEQPVVGPGSPEGSVPPPQPQQAAPLARQSAAPHPGTPATPVEASRPLPKPVPVAAKPAVAMPPPRPVEEPRTGAIQLGAFSTEAKANAAWKSLAKRFGFLGELTKVVSPVKSGETTLYRLRASGPGAGALCQKLRVAGETCSNV